MLPPPVAGLAGMGRRRMADKKFSLTELVHGFQWGPATVTRCVSDPKWGVVIQVQGPREMVNVRVTPSGLVRIDGPYKRIA